MVGETLQKIGQTVRLFGWVQTVRTHGKIVFFDLRDRTGIIQTVIFPKNADFELAKGVRSEWVVEIVGKINERPANMVNDKIATGKVELAIEKLAVLAKAQTLPISIEGDGSATLTCAGSVCTKTWSSATR